nr:hypothetical protein [Rhodococcus sp. (in: high G+C Gram-positive bacteria)]
MRTGAATGSGATTAGGSTGGTAAAGGAVVVVAAGAEVVDSWVATLLDDEDVAVGSSLDPQAETVHRNAAASAIPAMDRTVLTVVPHRVV